MTESAIAILLLLGGKGDRLSYPRVDGHLNRGYNPPGQEHRGGKPQLALHERTFLTVLALHPLPCKAYIWHKPGKGECPYMPLWAS